MSDDQQKQAGRFLNEEDDSTPVPGLVISQTQFPSPSTGNRQAIGGANPFQQSPTPFHNPHTGQFQDPARFQGPSTGQFPTPFPNSPTGQFGNPMGAPAPFPNSPTGQFGNPMGAPAPFPNSQTGQFASPMGAPAPFPNSQTGQFANPFPNSPTGQFANPFPNSPTGQFANPVGAPTPFPGTPAVGAPVPAGVIAPNARPNSPPDTRMRVIYGSGGAAVGLLLGLLLGILNSGLEQMSFTQGIGVTIQMAVWFMLLFGIAFAFKPERVAFILRKHGIMD